VV
ncbi:hypothetical protein D046_8338B, partial [Vibrio parahaemolyticus V-223/04]|jgi:hypothetical protein